MNFIVQLAELYRDEKRFHTKYTDTKMMIKKYVESLCSSKLMKQ